MNAGNSLFTGKFHFDTEDTGPAYTPGANSTPLEGPWTVGHTSVHCDRGPVLGGPESVRVCVSQQQPLDPLTTAVLEAASRAPRPRTHAREATQPSRRGIRYNSDLSSNGISKNVCSRERLDPS